MSRTAQAFASEPAVDSAPREEITIGSDKRSSGPGTDIASGKGLMTNMQQTFSSVQEGPPQQFADRESKNASPTKFDLPLTK